MKIYNPTETISVCVLHGEARLELDKLSIHLFWPYIRKTNLDFGIKADTRLVLKWRESWSEEKMRSFGILLLGFGFGFRKVLDDTPATEGAAE